MESIRIHSILEYLKTAKTASLNELKEKFGVSTATIHRDAAVLSRRASVERVKGGLLYVGESDSGASGSSYLDRVVANRAGKLAASRKAISHIEDGDIIFLDSSTTIHELAALLHRRKFNHLTIVTNSVPVMQRFSKFPTHWSLIGLGGDFDPQLNSFVGEVTMAQLSGIRIGKAFVSAFGLDGDNATTNHARQAELLSTVLASAAGRYLVIDRTKLGRTGLYKVAQRSLFTEIITG